MLKWTEVFRQMNKNCWSVTCAWRFSLSWSWPSGSTGLFVFGLTLKSTLSLYIRTRSFNHILEHWSFVWTCKTEIAEFRTFNETRTGYCTSWMLLDYALWGKRHLYAIYWNICIQLERSVYKGDSKRLSERVSAREKLSVKTGKQERKSVTGQTLSCVLRLFR